jgi:hypothetical protein
MSAKERALLLEYAIVNKKQIIEVIIPKLITEILTDKK